MKIILTEKRELVTKNGKKGYVINGTFIPLDDSRQDGKNDGVPEVTGGNNNKGAQGTQKDNSGVTTVTPGSQGTQTNKGAQGTQTNKGAQGTQTNQGAQDNSDEGSKVARTGEYSTDKWGRDYDDDEYGQPPKKVEPTNQGAQGAQGTQKVEPKKVEPPKPTNPSGKVLPTPKAVKPNSTRERMINKNVEIHGADRIIKLRNQNAAFQATRNKKSGYTMDDFVKDFPDSNTAKERRASGGGNHPDLNRVLGRSNSSSKSSTNGDKLDSKTHYTSKIGAFLNNKKVGDKKGNSRHKSVQQIDHNYESYDAYDLVLDYVITEGHAENQDEANYVMMQMSQEQIQHIVSLYEV